MTEGDAREIAHAFRVGLEGLLSDREIEQFLEAVPDPADRFERLFRLAEATRVGLDDFRSIESLKPAAAELFAYAEDMDDMADRLASTRPPDLTLEDGFVMTAWMKEAQRAAYRMPLARVAVNLRRFLVAGHS